MFGFNSRGADGLSNLRARSMAAINNPVLIGFDRISQTPRSALRDSSESVFLAENMMTGICAHPGRLLARSRVSHPSIGSMEISRRIRSGITRSSVSRASSPLPDTRIWYPFFPRIALSPSTMNLLSSTRRIVVTMAESPPWQRKTGDVPTCHPNILCGDLS